MKSQITAKSIRKPVKTMSASVSSKPSVKPTSAPSTKRHTGPGKTFHKDGHWIENPRKTSVLVCTCGNKYLKTRHGQNKCLRCLSMGK
jgi:hypothetical protein